MQSCDVIVIGGGVNGLAAAGRLAKSGRKVIVVEASAAMGGGAETREFAPGYRSSGLAHILNQFDPRVEQELSLASHGLAYVADNLATTALSADGRHIAIADELIGDVAAEDRVAWAALRAKLMRYAEVLRPLKEMTPPRLAAMPGKDLWSLAKLGLSVRRMGQADLRELMRLLLINVADVLNDEIGDERLKGAIAFDTVLGSHLGPRSPNSLLLLLHRLSGTPLRLPAGGMGSVAAALVKAVSALDVDLRSAARVASLAVADDRVTGVTLETGETLAAPTVLAAINPRTALLKLLGPRHLDTDFVRRVQNVRMRGSAVKFHVALKATPDFRQAELRHRLLIAPSINAVETSFNAVKYGDFSPSPVMEITVPSAHEAGFAPQGHHVLSIIAQYAPFAVKDGWVKARRALEKALLDQLEAHAPGLRQLVVATELLTPEDIEQRYGLLGGNWHHGELAVEQMLFLRPTADTADYTTPVKGFYLGGGGSHPGGGISGAAGWNAAGKIIAQETR